MTGPQQRVRWAGRATVLLLAAVAACQPGARGAVPDAFSRLTAVHTAAVAPVPRDAGATDAPRSVQTTLLDNLISNDVLRGALVSLDGRPGMRVSSDRGTVLLDSLVPGVHALQAWHPLLDSIGIAGLRVDVTVRSGDTSLVAALPTPTELFTQLCGVSRGRTVYDGVLMGVVRRGGTDEPAADVEVAAGWRFADTTYLGAEMRERARVRTTASGQFVICRVPRFTPVELWARSDSTRRPPRVRLQLGAAVMGAFDLSVPGPSPDSLVSASRGEISGRVMSSSGDDLPNVTIRLDGTSVQLRTDSIGMFRFPNVAPGLRTLEIRAIGFRPSRIGINVRPGQRIDRVITIDRTAAMLGTVVVRGVRRATWDSLGFVERQRRGGGYFLTRETLKGVQDLTTALRMVPGISGASNLQRSSLRAGRGAGCFPAYVVNGVPFGANSTIGPEAFIRAEDVRGIEVYTSKVTTPPEYQRYLDCSVIVIWLRDPQAEREAAQRRQPRR